MILTWLLENITYTGPIGLIVAGLVYTKLFKKKKEDKPTSDERMRGVAIAAVDNATSGADNFVEHANEIANIGDVHNQNANEILVAAEDPNQIRIDQIDPNTSIEGINDEFANKGF